jgi:hypothetical protein
MGVVVEVIAYYTGDRLEGVITAAAPISPMRRMTDTKREITGIVTALGGTAQYG